MATPSSVAARVDVIALKDAIEGLDATALLNFYADDAVLISMNHDSPPRTPSSLVGKAQIAAHLTHVCGDGVSAHVDRLVAGGDGAAYLLTVAYPDGTRTVCATLLDLRDGKITREVGVQAWDVAAGV